jgi:hypothetical protein
MGAEVPFQSFGGEGGLQFLGGTRRSRTIFDLVGCYELVFLGERRKGHTAWGSDRDLGVEDVFAEQGISFHIFLIYAIQTTCHILKDLIYSCLEY